MARVAREGVTSCAAIDADISKRIISACWFLLTGCGIFTDAGPAKAITAISQAIAQYGQRTDFFFIPLSCLSITLCRLGSITCCHALVRCARCFNSHNKIGVGASSNSHKGRKKWKSDRTVVKAEVRANKLSTTTSYQCSELALL